MSPERFENLLHMVAPTIQKQDTKFREAISAEERLVVTLRFLATGDAQQSISYSFRIGKTTLSHIISETCDAIYQCLKDTYLSPPTSEDDWLKIAGLFEEKWNMPHVLGAIDGKHMRIECPKLTGSQYFNYKGFFSLVLLAICDANYCFTMFDLGQYGSNNDNGVLLNSEMGQMFQENELKVPKSRPRDGIDGSLPFYLLGDEIFPLKTWLMRPYPGHSLDEERRVYNYRHSRARRTIENAFGILSARWRIFHKPIKASTTNVERYVLACMTLHNYLRQTDNAFYSPTGFTDSDDGSGVIRLGEWRSTQATGDENGCFRQLRGVRGSRYGNDAIKMRETLTSYVNSEDGCLPWQLDYIRRTSFNSSEN